MNIEHKCTESIIGLTLNGSDMSLFQILQSLQDENDCIFIATTPPKIVMSTAEVINTSSNEAIVKARLKMTGLLPE